MSTQKACNSSINPKSWKLSGQSKCQPKKLAAVDLKSVHSKMSTQKACSCQPKKSTFQNFNPKSIQLSIYVKSVQPKCQPKRLTAVNSIPISILYYLNMAAKWWKRKIMSPCKTMCNAIGNHVLRTLRNHVYS